MKGAGNARARRRHQARARFPGPPAAAGETGCDGTKLWKSPVRRRLHTGLDTAVCVSSRFRHMVEQMAALIGLARELTTPSFADYLEFARLTAMRPGEMDGLGWDEIDAEGSEVDVRRQWNAKAQRFTTPKYGCHRVSLVSDAHAVLERAAAYRRDGVPWVFPTERGHHFTPSSRNHHWNRVRAAAGLGDMTLYLATRHFCAWRLYVVLGLPKEVVAAQLGHKDGGKLIEELYGHPDTGLRLRAVREAYNAARTSQDGPDAPPDPSLPGDPDEARPNLRVVAKRAA
jgi:hypothetical protein